jgi:hypothetical protein
MHTAREWKPGKTGGCVVSDARVSDLSESEKSHYGGHLIAESIAAHNIPIIVAAPDLLVQLKALYREYLKSRPMAYQDGVALDTLEAIMKAESW